MKNNKGSQEFGKSSNQKIKNEINDKMKKGGSPQAST
jgi:hypothetical protein